MNTVHLHENLPIPPALRVRAVINTDALTANYRTLLSRVRAVSPHTHAIAVVKADAYGHGLRPCVEALLGVQCRSFAVSCLEEAVALRRLLREILPKTADTDTDILILGYTAPENAPILAQYAITTTLLSESYTRALLNCARAHGVTVKVHAALDTGMNRIGYPAHNDREIHTTVTALRTLFGEGSTVPAQADSRTTADAPPAGGLVLDGLFTHFARADEDCNTEMDHADSLTMTQYARYRRVLDDLVSVGIRPRVCHVCNSAAAVRFPTALPAGCLDAVRLGINLYGYGVDVPANTEPISTASVGSASEMRPVMRLETVVSHTHTLLPGETVGYGGAYAASTPRKLATLPVGYADGWLRAFSGATVTIHTKNGDFPAPTVGRICMDQCMVDVTDIPVTVATGDRVTLFGAHRGELEALSARAHTITYELLCLITARVPRVYAPVITDTPERNPT